MLNRIILTAFCSFTPDPMLHEYIHEASIAYEISEPLITSVIIQESGCRTNARNGNAIGLGQINKDVWGSKLYSLGYCNLWDAKTNVMATGYVLHHYGAHTEYVSKALAGYLGAWNQDYINSIKTRAKQIKEWIQK